MSWTELDFGKHRGLTLPQVLFKDPDWFFWAVSNDAFRARARLKSEALDLNEKARQIKVPQFGRDALVVEYWIHSPTRKFSHFDLVPESRPHHVGSSSTHRSNVIDMSYPRCIAPYDKLGCKSMLSSLKHYLFGSKSARMTKQRCEDFFDEPQNFVRSAANLMERLRRST